MSFAKRLQYFMHEQNRMGKNFDAIDMTRAFIVQLAACIAVASVKSGEPIDAILDSICDTIRKTAHQCRTIELKRRN